MSQKTHQDPDPKHPPTSEHKRHGSPIGDVSPDDPFPVPDDGTSKPPLDQQPGNP